MSPNQFSPDFLGKFIYCVVDIRKVLLSAQEMLIKFNRNISEETRFEEKKQDN